MVEQEKIHRLIERLKMDDDAAAGELVQRGDGAVPHLLERWSGATWNCVWRRWRC